MKKALFISIIVIAGIAKQSQGQIITTVAGNGTGTYAGDGGQASVAEIYNPMGVTLDTEGNLFIADEANERIRKVNTNGIISTVAGDGADGSSGDGGQATAAEFRGTFGVAIDGLGNIYIADNNSNCIRKVNTNGIILNFAGNGSSAYSGDGGQATAASLNQPTGVALDAIGNVYIADNTNNCIRKVNTSGIITTIAGNGTGSYSGDGGQATAAELYNPWKIAFDATGNLYIADGRNNRIRKVNTNGIISTYAGNGTLGYSGDGGVATSAELNYPWGVAVDGLGNVYIADEGNNCIRIVNTSGVISTFAGNGTPAYFGNGGPAKLAYLNTPVDVAIDVVGNVYIADAGNNVIRKVSICLTPAPTISASVSSPTICSGDLVTLAASGVTTYTWSSNADSVTTNTVSVSPFMNTTYTVTGIAGTCVAFDTVSVIVTSCAGIEQITNSNEQINIYPNPNNGSFVIERSSATKQTMQVYDVNGKLVLSQTILGKTTVDASSLNEGVYTISLLSAEGILNKKLVIVR